MTQTITRAEPDEFDTLIAFLDAAFGHQPERSFAGLLPVIYRPTAESMGNQFVIRDDGQIAACVGLFPITWRLGAQTLRIAGIGGVSVGHAFRGRGLMRRLMSHVADHAIERGYHLSYLGGQRQRYAYFGWESAGAVLRFRVTRDNIRHAGRAPRQALSLRDFVAQTDLPPVEALRAGLFGRCDRPRPAASLHNWLRTPKVLTDADGEIAAYLVHSGDGAEVVELAARDDDTAEAALAELLRSGEQDAVNICTDAVAGGWPRRLAALAESQQVVGSGNWRVFDWPATLAALLSASLERTPLPEGSVVLEIDRRCYRLSVRGDSAACEPSDGPADAAGDALLMTRLLFGPLRPTLVHPLPRDAAALLDAWCPLPLSLPKQDHV